MERITDTLSAVEFNSVAGLLELGGPVVLLLLALSVVVLTIAVGKLAGFLLAGVGRHRHAREAVRLYHAGDLRAARRRTAAGPVSAIVVGYAIEAAGAMTPCAARDAAEKVALLQLHRLRRGIGLLDVIAQIAPLLGLFGTVLGMIEAFRALEGSGAAVDPSVLAGGIWVALLTTAVGLAVAMPASVLTAWFEARIANEEVALENLLSGVFSGAPLPAPRPAAATAARHRTHRPRP
ncbi:MotA/TolQ/ExbB proton channel family protein [Acuticoccus sp. I52.16.1]|uniref:MotA/TolQ/ExbB proton channel family protein n=1 Tax=Acuticoccus sp. I52.16.1 TaxID=2928472 RepID=UPI001FD25135|nr:MotA/TolQ/ExbB proton channel family protein [Acuticoccus sp. I52.16.1]UOM36162.1 MotA/TolQ/ExbB proton channel family protein [Acuticoccus sp. I52.16.1]